MKDPRLITIARAFCALFVAGCAGSGSAYIYRAATNNCNCEEYRTTEERYRIEYRFRAQYTMDHGIATTITIEFRNHSDDTLFLDPGMVKISSRNVSYRYNNKFIPLPMLIIPPGDRDEVKMTGTDVAQTDDWNKVAGEQLTVTLKSIRIGKETLPEKSVVFIPVNPKLGNIL